MFNAYEFSFAGESSLMRGLMLYDFGGKGQGDVSFGNIADVIETRTTGKIQPIHFGVNYNSKPLEFKLIFGSDHAIDRYAFEDISFWLTGHQQYQWLSIDQPDLNTVQFRCLITQLTPVTYGWLPFAFEATVRCDCPYAYGYPFEEVYDIEGETSLHFLNDSSVREYIRPLITFEPSHATTELRITNISDGGREFILSGIPTGTQKVRIDNSNGIIEDMTAGYNLYPGFNLNFFRLVQGDNHMMISGDGRLTISGRSLHNVAG